MGDPTGSYATASIALRVSRALKPHHHNKVEIPSVGHFGINCSFVAYFTTVTVSRLYGVRKVRRLVKNTLEKIYKYAVVD
jgi:hypothetical protein